MGLGTVAGGRKRSETTLLVGGGRPNPAFASCLRGELLPQAATYPEHPLCLLPRCPLPSGPSSFHPSSPSPPRADLGMGGGNRMARVPLDSAVRAGLEGERSCPKMVTFIPFFKLKSGREGGGV